MKKILSLVLTLVLIFCTCTGFASAKTGTGVQNLDSMSDVQLEEIIAKYGLERVDPDDLPEGVTPLKVNTEKELQSLSNTVKTPITITNALTPSNVLGLGNNGGITINDYNPGDGGGGGDYDKIPGTYDALSVLDHNSLTPTAIYQHKYNTKSNGKVSLSATINFSTNQASSGISLAGTNLLYDLTNTLTYSTVSDGIAQIWGEGDLNEYVLIKLTLFKTGTARVYSYMKYVKYHQGLKGFYCYFVY